jgi:hypothetical protein
VQGPNLPLARVKRVKKRIQLDTGNTEHGIYTVCEQPFNDRFSTIELRHVSPLD